MENEKIIEVTQNYFTAFSDPDIARYIHEEDASVGAMWERVSSQFAALPAISDLDKTYSYGEMDADVAKLRGALAAAGVKKGSFVGVLIPNSYHTVKAFLAAVSLGAVAVMIPPHLDGAVVKGMSMGYRFAALIYSDTSAEKVQPAGEVTKLVHADAEAEPVPAADCAKKDPCVAARSTGATASGSSTANASSTFFPSPMSLVSCSICSILSIRGAASASSATRRRCSATWRFSSPRR